MCRALLQCDEWRTKDGEQGKGVDEAIGKVPEMTDTGLVSIFGGV